MATKIAAPPTLRVVFHIRYGRKTQGKGKDRAAIVEIDVEELNKADGAKVLKKLDKLTWALLNM